MSKPPYEKQEKIEFASAKDLPPTPISLGIATVNRTGSWRYMMPLFEDKTPPCNNQCPASVDIEGMMRLVGEGKFEEAYLLLRKENPFSAICGAICPHPCEKVCNRGRFDRALAIRAIERMVAEFGLERDIPIEKGKEREGKVAIVGGGPIGLSAGYFLTLLGYKVDLFEQEEELGGALRAIGLKKLPQKLLEKEVAFIEEVGVNIITGKKLGESISLEDLRNDYQAILLALGYPPEKPIKPKKDGSLETDIPGVFALALKEGDIASAVAEGKRGAIVVDCFISKKEFKPEQLKIGEKGPLSFRKYCGEKIKRSDHIASFSELNLAYFEKNEGKAPDERRGYSPTEAKEEASRCFHCGVCNMCGNCYTVCPDAAIQPLPDGRGYRLHYGYCKGCLLCVNECPRAAMSFKEVER